MQAGNSICVEPGRFWKIQFQVPEAQEGEKVWQNKRKKKWKKKAWNVVIVTRRQRPAPKKKKTITEPFKPHGRTVKRYQPDAGREPLLR